MRDYKVEFDNRVNYIKNKLIETNSKGIVYGNSGGKDCALVGILSKAACNNVTSIIMPCNSKQNYESDMEDAKRLAEQFNIDTKIVDLTKTRNDLIDELEKITTLNDAAIINIPPRLRMTTLYAYGASHNYLVAGTGNKSERYIGYFTKWGDGACDFNPISDLTVNEIYEFLRYLKAPQSIIDKKPSAGLYAGQNDEDDLGVTYQQVENHINGIKNNTNVDQKIKLYHDRNKHKIDPISTYIDSIVK